MTCPDETTSGAYLLGALEPAEQAEFAAHLEHCPTCSLAVTELGSSALAVAALDINDVADHATLTRTTENIDPQLFERVRGEIEADDRRVVRRRRWLTGAAAVLILIGVGAGIGLSRGGSNAPTFSAQAGAVHLAVSVVDAKGGAQLHVSAAGLPEDEHCRLIAISRSGASEPAGDWTVSYQGSAKVVGMTSYTAAQLAKVELFGTTGQLLVTVPTERA